jgi:hypothetical protein
MAVEAPPSKIIVQTPPGLDEEWEWILLTVLGEWMGVRWERHPIEGAEHIVLISDNDNEPAVVTLSAEFWLSASQNDALSSKPIEPLVQWRPDTKAKRQCLTGPSIPILFGGEEGLDLPIDIFGSAFWMLARVEEINPASLDAHERFAGDSSISVRESFFARPIIDEYVELLLGELQSKFPELQLAKTQFRLQVTHDVDSPSEFGHGLFWPWARGLANQMIRNRNPSRVFDGLKRIIRSPQQLEANDPHNTFDYLMTQSEKRGIASEFYFFGGRTDNRKDAGYMIDHPAITDLLLQIHSRGHKIGLHPSYHTYRNPAALKTEKDNLVKCCHSLGIDQVDWGGRMHFLRWRWPDTARSWVNAGLAYDSTLGFADRAGFRCGTAREFSAFDPVDRKVLSLRIRPLIMMECSVIAERYMDLGYGEDARALAFDLKDKCRKYGGVFTLLWHNSHLSSQADKDFYEAILDH